MALIINHLTAPLGAHQKKRRLEMNLKKLGLILACLMLLIATAAHADNDQGAQPMGKMETFFKSNHFGKDLGFSLGVKTWLCEWSLPVEMASALDQNGSPIITDTQILQFESDTELTFIPTFMVRYRNFFIGGTYLPEKAFDFTSQNHTFSLTADPELEGANLALPTELTVSGERREWDLNIGYFITSNFAVSLGYKRSWIEHTNILTF